MTDPASPLCLGLDPGLGTLGYGLVRQKGDRLLAEEYGVVRTPPGEPLPDRLRMLYEELRR
ncbi:crossover junction endodeoxyribonuclease RuvC, partial [Aminomonas paucivorans]